MLEAKLQENKLLLKCIKESDALKSLLDTPHKHVLFCPTVSVNKDGKITEMPGLFFFVCVVPIPIQPCVLRHHQGHVTSQTAGQAGGGSVKLQLSSSEILELIRTSSSG